MKHNLLIRQYRPDDLSDLMLAWESANCLAHPFLKEEFVAQVRRDIPAMYIPNSDTWVAELEGLVVGFISIMGNEVGAIFLLPDYHGSGIGAALINKAHKLVGDLELEVFEKNAIGRCFYERYGFKKVDEKLHEQSGETVYRLRYIEESSQL